MPFFEVEARYIHLSCCVEDARDRRLDFLELQGSSSGQGTAVF